MSNHYNELHSTLHPHPLPFSLPAPSILFPCLSFLPLPFLPLPCSLPFSFRASLSSLHPFLSTKMAFFVLRRLRMCILSTKSRVFVLRPHKIYPLSTKTAYFVLSSLKKCPLSTKMAFFVLRRLKKYPLSTKSRVFVLRVAFFWLSATNSPCFVPDPGPSGEICHKNAKLCQDIRRHQQLVRKSGGLRILPCGLSHNERIKK